MNAPETTPHPVASTPAVAPDAAQNTNSQPVAANAPQEAPDTVAAAPNTSQSKPIKADDTETANLTKDPNWLRRLRPPKPLIGIPKAEPCVAEFDLRLEGSLRLTGRSGVVMKIPINLGLPGILTPAFLPLAQQQFEMVVQELLVKPATIAFIAYLEDVKAARNSEAGKAKQAIAVEQEKAEGAAREMLNRKGSPL